MKKYFVNAYHVLLSVYIQNTSPHFTSSHNLSSVNETARCKYAYATNVDFCSYIDHVTFYLFNVFLTYLFSTNLFIFPTVGSDRVRVNDVHSIAYRQPTTIVYTGLSKNRSCILKPTHINPVIFLASLKIYKYCSNGTVQSFPENARPCSGSKQSIIKIPVTTIILPVSLRNEH